MGVKMYNNNDSLGPFRLAVSAEYTYPVNAQLDDYQITYRTDKINGDWIPYRIISLVYHVDCLAYDSFNTNDYDDYIDAHYVYNPVVSIYDPKVERIKAVRFNGQFTVNTNRASIIDVGILRVTTELTYDESQPLRTLVSLNEALAQQNA